MKTWLAAAALALAAAHAPGARAVTYAIDPAASTLSFAFEQAGARNTGRFARFEVKLTLEDGKPAAGRLDVRIFTDSLDTGDEERDGVLRGADLFHTAEHPLATFTSSHVRRLAPGRYEALGRLTIRGVARNVRVPFRIAGDRMTGGTTIRRLDFGVGQGEWKSTEWVDDAVKVSFALRLAPAAPDRKQAQGR